MNSFAFKRRRLYRVVGFQKCQNVASIIRSGFQRRGCISGSLEGRDAAQQWGQEGLESAGVKGGDVQVDMFLHSLCVFISVCIPVGVAFFISYRVACACASFYPGFFVSPASSCGWGAGMWNISPAGGPTRMVFRSAGGEWYDVTLLGLAVLA